MHAPRRRSTGRRRGLSWPLFEAPGSDEANQVRIIDQAVAVQVTLAQGRTGFRAKSQGVDQRDVIQYSHLAIAVDVAG